jgi:hypothetical protein
MLRTSAAGLRRVHSTAERNMETLAEELHEKIKRLCAEGDDAAKDEDFDTAVERYGAAWNLLPDPRTQWEAATWILAAIGDAHYLAGEFERGRKALLLAMQCPDAIGNPFLHLRLGQCQFELGFQIVAGDEFIRAYTGGGDEVFRGEDPKYYDYLQSVLRDRSDGSE